MQLLAPYIFVLFLHSGDINFSQAEQDWLYLANIMVENTYCAADPVEKLRLMTNWLNQNVKHVPKGRYPRHFDGRSVVTVVKGGMGNCGYQSYNIVGFAKLLGYHNHRVLHHRKNLGAPGDHAFAEIKVGEKWVVYDPDKFLYFPDGDGDLMSVNDIAANEESWVGISIKNKGFKETKSPKKIPKAFDYKQYEEYGMIYLKLSKLMSLGKSQKQTMARNKP